MRNFYLVCNWKMFPKNKQELLNFWKKIEKILTLPQKSRVVLCPPFVYLDFIPQQLFKINSPYLFLGAQDSFWKNFGPFTGEISPEMLKSFNVSFVILNHSERITFKGETYEMSRWKIENAINCGLKSIVCLGEFKKGKFKKEISFQFDILFSEKYYSPQNLILVWEPVWAISTNLKGRRTIKKEETENIISFLKQKCQTYFKRDDYLIFYGGSVKPYNIEKIIASGFDGVLIGSSSISPKDLRQIVKIAESVL